MKEVRRIASFSVDHDKIAPGIYVSRIDGDVTTYDLRTRVPNGGDYMSDLTMHSVEHLFATYVRSSRLGDRVIYFGPMGCQTGFYLLVREADNGEVLSVVTDVLREIETAEAMPGESRVECGNYKNLSLDAGKAECRSMLKMLTSRPQTFKYPE